MPKRFSLLHAAAVVCMAATCSNAQDSRLYPVQINSDGVNIRCDATVTAPVITQGRKGEVVDVVMESYDWYKIRLSKSAPSYVRKDLVTAKDDKAGVVAKEIVNIRLQPNEASPILGKAHKDEIVNILQDEGSWYKIEPVRNSYGWIHKKFADKNITAPVFVEKPAEPPVVAPPSPPSAPVVSQDGVIVVEGALRPYGKIFGRKATHKLITKDKKTYLLQGNKQSLDDLGWQNLRVTGRIQGNPNQKVPILEVLKMEVIK